MLENPCVTKLLFGNGLILFRESMGDEVFTSSPTDSPYNPYN